MTKIGVAISTVPERRELLEHTVNFWKSHLPKDAILIITTDESKEGVATIKNFGLSKLEQMGVTDYFLSDDDTYPIHDDWWKPFVESPEPHMMFNFKLKGKPVDDMRVLYQDDKIVSYSHTRGCMIYVNEKVLDTVGGMDERYYNGFEHADWTNRVHNAGLTTHRSMSPVNCDQLFYCLDQENMIESSIKNNTKHVQNAKLYRMNKLSKEYMRYK